MKRKARGRPRQTDALHATPVFREKPDIEKLGRAVIALAEELAKQEDKDGSDHEKNC